MSKLLPTGFNRSLMAKYAWHRKENTMPIRSALRSNSIYGFLLLLVLFLPLSSKGHNDNSTNDREAVLAIINALRTHDHPRSGKGKAIVREIRQLIKGDELEPVAKENYLEFSFSGDMTRSIAYDTAEGCERKCHRAFTVGKTKHAYYGGINVMLKSKPSYHWYRRYGTDFHPDTFSSIQSRLTIADLLENAVNQPSLIRVESKDNGLVKVMIGDSKVAVLDKRKGYRLVEFKLEHVSQTRNINYRLHIQISWKRYGAVWYVDKATRKESSSKTKFGAAFDPPILQIEIQEFEPNVDIGDLAFEVEALELPEGTKIIGDI